MSTCTRVIAVALALLGIGAVGLARAGASNRAPAGRRYSADRILVTYQPRATAAARQNAALRVGLRAVTSRTSARFARLQLSTEARAAGVSIEQSLAALRQDPTVRFAEPDYLRHGNGRPNDAYFSNQWNLENTGQTGGISGADIGAPAAWDVIQGSDKVTVAVIDTGVDYSHPDLTDNILRDSTGAVVGYDFANADADPMDDNGHGTHCAGILGARGNNGAGISGVCQRVKIMPLKFLDAAGDGYDSDAVDAIDWAVAHGAQVINASWGGADYSQTLLEAIQRARDEGVLFVTAAGNSGDNNDTTPTYPANFNSDSSNVISVAATTASDRLPSWSNYGGNTVDIAAPGADIFSTVLNQGYESYDGTSMAAPHVAGAAALALAQDNSLTLSQLKSRVLNAVAYPTALSGKVKTGRLSISKMVSLTGYTIQGTVTLSGAGLEGVTVTAGGKSASTQSDGTYTVVGLSSGTYNVAPSATGYTFSPTARSVTVGPNQTGVDFAASTTGGGGSFSISGTITTGGSPLAGVTVVAGSQATTSAADGSYKFTGLTAGSYTVQPSLSGYSFSPSSSSVTVGPSKTGVDFTAALIPTYRLAGKVTESGSGLSGVTVSLGSRTTQTSGDGTYSFSGLVSGTYTVTPSRSGYAFTPTSRTLSVSSDTSGVNFTAARTTNLTLSGTIRLGGSGLSGVSVTAGGKTATTASNGTYQIGGLDPGTYTVIPKRTGYGFSPASLSLTLTTDTPGADFTAFASYSISGTVRLNGAALSGVTVTAGSATETTASNGTYTLTGLAAGTYTVSAYAPSYTFSPSSQSVTLGPDATGVDFAATSTGYVIQGRVTLASAGLGGVVVTAGNSSTSTGEDGSYSLALTAKGTYTVRPALSGYAFTPAYQMVQVGSSPVIADFTAAVAAPDPTLSAITLAPASLKGGKKATGTITLSGITQVARTVTLSSSVPSVGTVPSSVVVKAGASSAKFTVSTKKVKKKRAVTITAALAGVTRTATLSVKP